MRRVLVELLAAGAEKILPEMNRPQGLEMAHHRRLHIHQRVDYQLLSPLSPVSPCYSHRSDLRHHNGRLCSRCDRTCSSVAMSGTCQLATIIGTAVLRHSIESYEKLIALVNVSSLKGGSLQTG